MTPAMAVELSATEGLGVESFPSAPDAKPLTLSKLDAYLKKCKGEAQFRFRIDKDVLTAKESSAYVDNGKTVEVKEVNLAPLGDVLRKYPDLRITMEIEEHNGPFKVSGLHDCKCLVAITLPLSTERIMADAFRNCVNLKTVVIKNSKLAIEHNPMKPYYVEWTDGEYKITTDHKGIEASAFWGCGNFQSKQNKNIGVINGMEFFYLDDQMTDIEIPGKWAEDLSNGRMLYNLPNLESAKVTEGCENFGAYFRDDDPEHNRPIFNWVFYNCPKFRHLELSEGVKNITGFMYMPSLETVKLPESVEVMGNISYCPKLRSINIPNHLKKNLEKDKVVMPTFTGCSSLETINVPGNIEEIPTEAFDNCCSLSKISIPKNARFEYDEYEDYNYDYDLSFDYEIEGIEDLAASEYLVSSPFLNCRSLEEIELPEGTERVLPYMFMDCENLKSVKLPNSIKYIGQNAFTNCKSLKSISLPEGLREIAQYAFSGCESLTDIQIPASVDSIGKGAFWACAALKNGDDPHKITVCGRQMDYYPADVELICPDNEVPANLFREYGALRSVVIPDNVTKINGGAFFCCVSLSKVAFPKSFEMDYLRDDDVDMEFPDPFLRCQKLRLVDIREAELRNGGQFSNVDTFVIRTHKYYGDTDFLFGKKETMSVEDLEGNIEEKVYRGQCLIKKNARFFVADNLVDRYKAKQDEENQIDKKGYDKMIKENPDTSYDPWKPTFQYEFLPLSGYRRK